MIQSLLNMLEERDAEIAELKETVAKLQAGGRKKK